MGASGWRQIMVALRVHQHWGVDESVVVAVAEYADVVSSTLHSQSPVVIEGGTRGRVDGKRLSDRRPTPVQLESDDNGRDAAHSKQNDRDEIPLASAS